MKFLNRPQIISRSGIASKFFVSRSWRNIFYRGFGNKLGNRNLIEGIFHERDMVEARTSREKLKLSLSVERLSRNSILCDRFGDKIMSSKCSSNSTYEGFS